MMTLVQWQQTRRVDHITIPVVNANQRYRGASAGLRNLKIFDANVAQFWGANNDFDRAAALALVYTATEAHRLTLVANHIEQRYINAVVALQQSAQAEMNQIWSNPNAYNALRRADMLSLATGQALAAKNVSLNVFYLVPVGAAPALGPIDAIINTHIVNANTVYAGANITFARANPAATVISQTPGNASILIPQTAPANVRGKFSQSEKLIATCNAALGLPAQSIDVVYLDNYDQDDVQGLTLQPSKEYGGAPNQVRPLRPIVTVTLNPPAAGAATYPTTLAHELGHALTGYGDHSSDVNNLMAGGAGRTITNNLSHGQIAWFRNNLYA